MLSRAAVLDRGIKLVTGTDAARDRIAVANALYSVQTETALECVEMAMEQCRLFNQDAMHLRQRGREELAAAAELKASQFFNMAQAIRARLGLEGK